jgi:hypothetical protein
MRCFKVLLVVAVASTVWAVCPAAHATTMSWDAAADMLANEKVALPATPTNPAGDWGWGYTTDGNATGFTKLPHVAAVANKTGLSGWADNTWTNPLIAVNVTSNNIFWGSTTIPVAPGKIELHPGVATLADLCWTAPRAGTFDVSASWKTVSYGSVDVHLVLESGTTSTSLYSSIANSGTVGGVSTQVVLAAGDVLNFLTGPNGGHNGDSTQFNATIADVTPSPEPSTVVLLLTGVIGLLAYAWRRRK